jgi:hypothetical protein
VKRTDCTAALPNTDWMSPNGVHRQDTKQECGAFLCARALLSPVSSAVTSLSVSFGLGWRVAGE